MENKMLIRCLPRFISKETHLTFSIESPSALLYVVASALSYGCLALPPVHEDIRKPGNPSSIAPRLAQNPCAYVMKPASEYDDLELKGLAEKHKDLLQDLGCLRLLNQTQDRQILILERNGVRFDKMRQGKYLVISGQFQNEYFGWNTTAVRRANDMYSQVVSEFIRPLLQAKPSQQDFDGYLIKVSADIVLSDKEWVEENLGKKMASQGLSYPQSRARRTPEEYYFYIPYPAAESFANGQISRQELQLRITAMLRNQEKLWGPP